MRDFLDTERRADFRQNNGPRLTGMDKGWRQYLYEQRQQRYPYCMS